MGSSILFAAGLAASIGATWTTQAAPPMSVPMALASSNDMASAFVEGKNSTVRSVFLASPGLDGEEGTTRFFASAPGRTTVHDLRGRYSISYAQESGRYALVGIGPVGSKLYIKAIEYIDEDTLELHESQHGLARDSWVARAAVFADDGEYIAFVGRRAADPIKLWLLQTATDTMKAIGAAPSPIPADRTAYDPLPRDWSDESFDDVIELAPELITFPTDSTIRVVYGDPQKGRPRTWQIPGLFGH